MGGGGGVGEVVRRLCEVTSLGSGGSGGVRDGRRRGVRHRRAHSDLCVRRATVEFKSGDHAADSTASHTAIELLSKYPFQGLRLS